MDTIFIVVFVYLTLQMLITWLIAQYINNPSVIDVAWPLGLVIAGFIYLYSPPLSTRNVVVGIILLIWGLRLARHLFFTRIKKGIVDKRYAALSEKWKINKSIGFLFHFQLQGWLIFAISTVFFFVSSVENANHLNALDYLAMICCVVGIVGESISDKQLLKFKQTHQKQVCDVGLWYFSRHPNCFFDWLTWFGFALFAVSAHYGWLSFISPLLIYLIMAKGTIPITEAGSIKSRGDLYIKYQKNTSMFFPWFKK